MLIGLTGLILSGKSTVRKLLHKRGFNTFDCDEISKALMRRGQILYNKILNIYGNQILNSKNEIDRKKLSEIVFNNRSKLRQLEKLSHPEIIKYIINNINKNKKNVVEASLLFESGLYKMMDLNIFVDSKIDNLIKRNNKSRKISNVILKKIIEIQSKKIDKKLLADIVLENNSSLKTLNKKVEILVNLIDKKLRADKLTTNTVCDNNKHILKKHNLINQMTDKKACPGEFKQTDCLIKKHENKIKRKTIFL